MADVNIIPRIRCDNCGHIEDKAVTGPQNARTIARPKAWGHCRIEGGRDADSYGGKVRLDFPDLCQACANAALDAAAAALKARRGEEEEGQANG